MSSRIVRLTGFPWIRPNEPATRRFSEDATNVLFVGPPGVGKTMLAVGLARVSIDAGYRTYYTTAAILVTRCHRAALEGRWATTMRFFADRVVLITDEVGYLPPASGAAAALITTRDLKSSTALTHKPRHRLAEEDLRRPDGGCSDLGHPRAMCRDDALTKWSI